MMVTSRGRNVWKKMAAVILFGLLVTLAGQVMADDTVVSAETAATVAGEQQYAQILALLQEQDKKNSREFRQVKRDIAALGQRMETPGISEILGGIGYILGVFGVASYVMSRKKDVSGGR